MIRYLAIIFTGILCSFYLFPISFTFFPIGNTKIYMALLGALCFMLYQIQNKSITASYTMTTVSFSAFAVSFAGLISNIYNGTSDYTYSQYIISMWVWVGAAYFLVQCIKYVHNEVTIELVSFYIIGVCVVQCVLAQMNEYIPSFKQLVDTYIEQGQVGLDYVKRMYGIGASLDTAGTRFACSLILLSYIVVKKANENKGYVTLLFLVFLMAFLTVAGNMVARTTLIGLLLGFVYFIFSFNKGNYQGLQKISISFIIILMIFIPVLVVWYYTSSDVRGMLRFAFEAFFSLFEKGNIETGSTNDLMEMWTHIPQDFKTWVIGDGYFMSPYYSDPYYLGNQSWAFYMGVDVGYLRFIYYFGLIGLFAFSYFFMYCTYQCKIKYPTLKMLFTLLLMMNFILWIKVATDIFFMFALFLIIDISKPEKDSTQIKLE